MLVANLALAGFLTGVIWHEHKGGHISAYPYPCALRAGASYNYLLVKGERRLTEREMLRPQGFLDSFTIACGYSATRKGAANTVTVPCVAAVVEAMLDAISSAERTVFVPVRCEVQAPLVSLRAAKIA